MYNSELPSQSIESDSLNEHLLDKIRTLSQKQVQPVAFIVPSEELLSYSRYFKGNIVVVVLNGVESQSIKHASPYIESEVKPRTDGKRIGCLMLADGKIALTNRIARHATNGLDEFHALWIFDDDMYLTTYRITDYLDDAMHITNIVEDSIETLTQEEVRAWQIAAQQTDYIGIFNVIDIPTSKD